MLIKKNIKAMSEFDFIYMDKIENNEIRLSLLNNKNIKKELFSLLLNEYHSKIDNFINEIKKENTFIKRNFNDSTEFTLIHFLSKEKRPEYYGYLLRQQHLDQDLMQTMNEDMFKMLKEVSAQCKNQTNMEFYSSFLYDVVDFEPMTYIKQMKNVLNNNLKKNTVMEFGSIFPSINDKIESDIEILSFAFFVSLSKTINEIENMKVH